jgi:hypothetical protein
MRYAPQSGQVGRCAWPMEQFCRRDEISSIPKISAAFSSGTVLLRIDDCRGLLQGFTFISTRILAFARHSCRAFANTAPGLTPMKCILCADVGWVCEKHPRRP